MFIIKNEFGQMNQYFYILKNLNTEWISIIEDDNIFYGLSNFINELNNLDLNEYSLYVSAGVSDYSKKDSIDYLTKEFFGSKNYLKKLRIIWWYWNI